jgi:hypothetical protein
MIWRRNGRMIERSNRVQRVLGPVGVMAEYIAPFQRYVVTNHQIIVNALPALRRDHERGISRSDYQPIIAEALIRFCGESDDYIRKDKTICEIRSCGFGTGSLRSSSSPYSC